MKNQYELSYRSIDGSVAILWVAADSSEAVNSIVDSYHGAISINELGSKYAEPEDINYQLPEDGLSLSKHLSTSVQPTDQSSQLKPFEITAPGFDGSSDTDDHILWVLATDIDSVEKAVLQSGVAATVTPLPTSFSSESGIDFILPRAKLAIIKRLKTLALTTSEA